MSDTTETILGEFCDEWDFQLSLKASKFSNSQKEREGRAGEDWGRLGSWPWRFDGN